MAFGQQEYTQALYPHHHLPLARNPSSFVLKGALDVLEQISSTFTRGPCQCVCACTREMRAASVRVDELIVPSRPTCARPSEAQELRAASSDANGAYYMRGCSEIRTTNCFCKADPYQHPFGLADQNTRSLPQVSATCSAFAALAHLYTWRCGGSTMRLQVGHFALTTSHCSRQDL